jgi:glycosyltransferase involved in cell wall biosynthesis
MARLTIGVPVYNGMPYLPASLACLKAQTFTDFEVMIFDNASQDDTARVAAEFCAADSRFHYFRQTFNKGPVANFRDVLQAAQSPYFAWRAADDFSSPDFFETLIGLLEATPGKDLAACRIVSRKHDGSFESRHDFPGLDGREGPADRLRLLFGAHASWIYGVFRREALLPLIQEVDAHYPDPWGWDYVALFPLLLAGRAVGTNATDFIQGLDPMKKARQDRRIRSDLKIRLRAIFLALADHHVTQQFQRPPARQFYRAAAFFYANKRICTWRKVMRGAWQRRQHGGINA